jgi:hypothetical protein
MHTELITMAKAEALSLYQKYKTHTAYSEPIDWEVQRTYQLLSKGNTIIRALESIKQAGLNREFLPKLALAPATAKACHIRRGKDGSMVMAPSADFWRERKTHLHFREETFVFPTESFPMSWDGKTRNHSSEHRAAMPMIPAHLKPKRGLANYHVLWEAEWKRIPPTDPYLLRRIGKADLWLVVAHWDLTEVERAAMATRV